MGELERCPDAGSRALLITTAVGEGDPAVLLADLREAQAPDELLRMTAATALRGRLHSADPELLPWADWLVEDLWARGHFLEAWVLRRTMPHGTLSPSLAAAAAAACTVHIGDALETAALEEGPPPGQAAALIALGAATLLAWSGVSGQDTVPSDLAVRVRDILEYLETEARPGSCWAELAALARHCPPGIVGEPGPTAIARGQLLRRHRDSKVVEAWEVLFETLGTAAATHFRFDAGLKTHEHLFHAQGLFGELRTAVEERELPAVVRWAARNEVVELSDHVDRTTAEVMAGHKNNILHSGKRRVYLERLRQVKQAAEAVAAFHHPHSDGLTGYLVSEARPTAIRLAEVWPALFADLGGHPAPQRHLTEHALTAMRDIREWGAVSETPPDELTAMIMDWPMAWRQPGLFALGLTGTGLTASGAADAVLEGLLLPVADPAGGVQRLIDSQDFRTARALLERACSGLTEGQRAELADRIDRAVAATRSELQPRVHRLAARATALGLSADEDYWSLLAHDSGEEARSALDEWETELDDAVAARRQGIEDRSGQLHPEQLVVALACLDSGEYDLAERVAAQPAYEPGLAGPASVSRPPRWPYGRHPSARVVEWFLGAAAAPADFGEHRPVHSDEHAWALLNAVHQAHGALDEACARRLADAFGHLVQDAPAIHRVQRTNDGGFTVELSCFVDSRLPWLSLSWRTTLHIGPEPPLPGTEPRLWLPTSDDRVEPPEGVAVVEPHFLFSLLTLDGEGRVRPTQWRRMNVLRHVSAQLPFDRVASLADQDLGDGTGTKAELLWLFDLLGLRAAPEVADMVLYYSAAVPAALEALLAELSRARRPRDLGHEDLTALRNSPEAARVLRQAVFAPLRDDVPAQVVCGALFGGAARLGTDRVSAEQLEVELEDLTMLLMEEYERERLRPRNLPLERIDADSALTRLENEGLVQRSGVDVVLPGTGLVSLLSGEETVTDTVKALRRLHENLDQAEELARLLLVSRTERSHQHVKKGHLYALEQLQSRLAKASDP